MPPGQRYNVSMPEVPPVRLRLPEWLKTRVRGGGSNPVGSLLARHGLATVCQHAHCPNQGECYARGTATFLILGETCTRDCRFCAIATGTPEPPRPEEPQAVAAAAAAMGLRHVVITSVTRDDLADGGAGHFAATIASVRRALPQAAIEVLVPDFAGDWAALETVLSARPDVLNHNIEMVERLYATLRPQARYGRSLELLARAKQHQLAHPSPRPAYTKSGLMLGLGETEGEVRHVLADLRGVGCDMLTMGQYLAPSPSHAPVAQFVTPERFEQWRQEAMALGFAAVAAGPLVRSSYKAGEVMPSGGPGSPSRV